MSRFAHLSGFERLEERDQPSAGPLGNLNATGSPAFLPFDFAHDDGATLNGKLYFLAADGTSNPALYSSDGTAGGTTLVKRVTPAAAAPAPAGWEALGANTSPVVAAGGKLYFNASGSPSGMWVSDGTAAGTAPLAVPGVATAGSSVPLVVNGRAVFTASITSAGGYSVPQLVASDGTAGGTVVLSNAASGVRGTVAAGGRVYFVTEDYNGGIGGPTSTLWRTDGTAAGTRAFATLPADAHVSTFSPDGEWLAAVGGKVYFAASSGGSGTELWVSDGTAAGTKMLKEINTSTQNGFDPNQPPYPRSSFPQQFTVVGNRVYFTADDGLHGQELWTTDGTTAGTRMVKDLSPTVGSPQFELTGTPSGSRLSGLTAFAGRLYFAADDGTTGQQFYVSNGTAAGTIKLTSAAHSANAAGTVLSANETPTVVAALGSKLLFGFGDAARGRQLWATDGTPAGTAVVSVIGTQTSAWDRALAGPLPVGVVGGRMLFSADEGIHGRQLWVTNGTAAGTTRLARLNPTDLGSDPQGFVTVGTRVLFTATDGRGAYSVFATDGTAAPTLVKRFGAGTDLSAPARPGPLVRSGGRAYFTLDAGSNGGQLWATDGTPAGTRLLKEVALPADLNPTGILPLGLANLTDVNGRLFFTVDLPVTGQQLWRTDGTPAGTALVKQVNANSSNLYGFSPPGTGPIRDLTANGGKLFFAADTDASSGQVWVSDGTAAGTKAVSALPAGAFLSPTKPDDLTVFKGKVYFTAGDGANGRRLWATDGTTAGTVAVSPARPLDQPQYTVDYYGAANMVAAGGKLFAVKTDGQLWATDGTAGGEVQLTRFVFGFGPPADVKGLTAVGGKVYFAATDRTGRQLWVSDGTAAGTKVVKVLGTPATSTNPYPAGGSPVVVAVVGSQVLFAADDGVHGRELWVTDGTSAGTKLAADLIPGAGSGLGSDPTYYGPAATAAVANGRLVLAGFSPAHGAEPWAAPLADLGITTSPPPVMPPAPPTGAGVVRAFDITTPAGVMFRGNLATVTLPDGANYSVTITWGDGSTSAGTLTRMTATGKTYTISGSHTYAAPASRPLSVRITANGQTVLTTNATATISDARFYAGRVAERVTAGRPFAGTVATIQGLNPVNGKASDYTAVIDWGDGMKSAGTVRRTAAGRYEVVGAHTLNATGNRTVTVTVTSSITGKVASAASIFLVYAPRPSGVR